MNGPLGVGHYYFAFFGGGGRIAYLILHDPKSELNISFKGPLLECTLTYAFHSSITLGVWGSRPRPALILLMQCGGPENKETSLDAP